jgi:hypothetical protein
MAGSWRRLHNKELHNMYTTPNTVRVIGSRKMKWAEYAACIGKMKNAYKILVGIPERKRPLFRMNLRETEWEGVE